MRIAIILSLYLLFLFTNGKTIKKTLRLTNFNKEGPFIFITKLHIGKGYGQLDITYTKGDQIVSQSFYNHLSLGIVNSTVYNQFSAASSCEKKESFLYQKERFNLRQEKHGMKHVGIYDLKQEQLWYFYLYYCLGNVEQFAHTKEEISLTVSLLNNGSHFGQNQQTLYGYIAIFIIWSALVIKFALPIATLLNFKNPDGLKLTIFGGLLLLGAGYLYRLIHLTLYNIDGSGIHIFEIFYLMLKNIGEAIITTMIVAISWGWSIIHLNSSQYYIIIGCLAGIINIVSLILSLLTEEHQELFHHYQTVPGIIILILRVIIFLVFISGIISCLQSSSGKITFFIRKLALIGSSYLLSWPITVIVVQLTFPNYMHKEIITFIQEMVHICACTILCNMIANPESAYRKVSLQEDDNPLGIENYHKK